MDTDAISQRTIRTEEQTVDANAERELHNAAHDSEHGSVTYLQQVHSGGFSVSVGPPDSLTESWFPGGSFVAFMDDDGPGHRSKVGPERVQRTLHVLRGHLDL